jgi:hypothetical protein
LPAGLDISGLQFQDSRSLCYQDKILNAGEVADIEFTLANNGKGIGFDVEFDMGIMPISIPLISIKTWETFSREKAKR